MTDQVIIGPTIMRARAKSERGSIPSFPRVAGARGIPDFGTLRAAATREGDNQILYSHGYLFGKLLSQDTSLVPLHKEPRSVSADFTAGYCKTAHHRQSSID